MIADAERRRKAADYMRRYRQTERGQEVMKGVRDRFYATEKGRVSKRVQSARQRKRWPERVAARLAVHVAVREGRMTKDACSRCGMTDRVEGHHYLGYEPEHWLDVVWICRPCHQMEHRRENDPAVDITDK